MEGFFVNKVFAGSALCFILIFIASGSELLVKTYPAGARDDNTAYLFKDETSLLSFIVYTKGEPVRMQDGKLEITLPEGLKVSGFGIHRTKYPASAVSCKALDGQHNSWTLDLGNGKVNTRYRVYHKYPLVPLTAYIIYVFVRPSGQTAVPDDFSLEWKLSANGIDAVSDKIKIRLIPLAKGGKMPKHFYAWTGFGFAARAIDKQSYDSFIRVALNCGINGIINKGAPGLPPYYKPDQLRKKGLQPVQMNYLNWILRSPSARYEKAGFRIAEKDRMLTYAGHRATSRKDNLGSMNLYCPSQRLDADSPVMKYLLHRYASRYREGFHIFFSDFEDRSYNGCFCEKCRKRFAEEEKLAPAEILKLSPEALIDKYPRQWFFYRCRQNAALLNALRKNLRPTCPEILIGINETRVDYRDIGFPGKGRGYCYFPEDIVTLDPAIDFHNTDNLASGVAAMQQLELWFLKNKAGEYYVKKPVIARVLSFVWINWGYWCVLGRMEQGKTLPQYGGMGCDWRPLNQKLEIANSAAIGVKGIEVGLEPSKIDALVANAVHAGMNYVGEFEPLLDKKCRQDWQKVKVYDLTGAKSPFYKIGPRGSMGRYFLGYMKKYGAIQYTYHIKDGRHLLSVFNWDYYQPKKIKVKFPGLSPKKQWHVNVYCDGKRSLLVEKDKKQTWSSARLNTGISVDVPAGGALAIMLSDKPAPGYADILRNQDYNEAGAKPIKLFFWRGKVDYSEKSFREIILKNMKNSLNKRLLQYKSLKIK